MIRTIVSFLLAYPVRVLIQMTVFYFVACNVCNVTAVLGVAVVERRLEAVIHSYPRYWRRQP